MRLLILILLLSAVNDKNLQNKAEKYLMPQADTMDVIEIKKQDYRLII